MNVLGHDHIAEDDEGVSNADLLQEGKEQVFAPGRIEQSLPAIATAGDEMGVLLAVPALETIAMTITPMEAAKESYFLQVVPSNR